MCVTVSDILYEVSFDRRYFVKGFAKVKVDCVNVCLIVQSWTGSMGRDIFINHDQMKSVSYWFIAYNSNIVVRKHPTPIVNPYSSDRWNRT